MHLVEASERGDGERRDGERRSGSRAAGTTVAETSEAREGVNELLEEDQDLAEEGNVAEGGSELLSVKSPIK